MLSRCGLSFQYRFWCRMNCSLFCFPPKKHLLASFFQINSVSFNIASVLVNLSSVLFNFFIIFFYSTHLLFYWLLTYKMYDFEFEIEQVLPLQSPWLVSICLFKISYQGRILFLSRALHTSFLRKGVESASRKVKLLSDKFKTSWRSFLAQTAWRKLSHEGHPLVMMLRRTSWRLSQAQPFLRNFILFPVTWQSVWSGLASTIFFSFRRKWALFKIFNCLDWMKFTKIKYFLLTAFEVFTLSYGPSFFHSDL